MPKCSFKGCSKSITIMCFDCKCGSAYCPKHRLPSDHECKYDFKSEGRKRIQETNPKIISLKVEII